MSLLNDFSSGGKFLSNDSSRRKFSDKLAGIFKTTGKGGGDSRGKAGKFTDYLKETSGGKGLDERGLKNAIESSDLNYHEKKDLLDIITSDEN